MRSDAEPVSAACWAATCVDETEEGPTLPGELEFEERNDGNVNPAMIRAAISANANMTIPRRVRIRNKK